VQYRVLRVQPTGLTVARGVRRCHRAPPELWRRPGGEEVKGPTSVAVPIDGTGTASVAPMMAPPVPGVQKPPRWVGKRFRDRLVAVPEGKVKKPAGLKTRPAWLRQDRLGANPAVCHGNTGCQVWRPQPYKQALRRLTAMTSSRDPTRMVKEWGPQRRTA
jgi:hypothetical protein